MHLMNRLYGKTAVITGGAPGHRPGRGKALHRGRRLRLHLRAPAARTRRPVAELGPNARTVKGSVSDEVDLDPPYVAVKAERGTLDIVFANAGVGSQLSSGATASELTKEALGEEGLNAYGSMTALQRMGDPAEVGAAAAFLASSDSSFMTGSEVAVDGGLAQL